VVEEVGAGVAGVARGDEMIGFTNGRASQAELVVVPAGHLVPRPPRVPWEQAGALFVAGTTAYAAVRAVSVSAGDTVVVSGAAGGVGSLAVQLARNAGARVIGVASEANHGWLKGLGVVPVAYGDGLADRLRAASGGRVDAFIDTFGGGYVELAIGLGVARDRVDTIIDFAAAAKYGVKDRGQPRGRDGRGPGGARRARRRRPPRDPHREDLPPRRGARRVPRARAAAHPRQDRAPALIDALPC
jgi:NADPH:quinone reductase-like Zn-dependent oxidoreductase